MSNSLESGKSKEKSHEDESLLVPVFTEGGKGLYVGSLYGLMRDKKTGEIENNPVATWASGGAVIDTRAYRILRDYCGSDKQKLDAYLKAVLDFETKHSDDHEHHDKRLPAEEEILSVLKNHGYFDE